MSFLFGLGAAGFALVLIFFVNPSSLTPVLRAAVIGARIIIGLCVAFIIYWIKHDNNAVGKDLFGNLMIDREILIGQWETSYQTKDNTEFKTIFSFYPDSSFYSSIYGSTGKWSYKDNTLTISYDGGSIPDQFKLYSYIDRTIAGKYSANFFKISNTPETEANIAEANRLRQERNRVNDKKYAGINLEGTWGFKSIQYDGAFIENLGAYELSKNGEGTYIDGSFSGDVKYKLDKSKKRFTLTKSDKIFSLKVQSFDGEILVGFADGEPKTQYVLSKAL